MTPILTAFKDSPDRGRGLARDMRVRWAFEELGIAYDVRLVTFDEMKTESYLALQPFGQIPAYQEGDLVLFESGAIVLYLAEKAAGLLPLGMSSRARAIAWMFSALNTVEPPIVELSMASLLERDKSWFKERLPMLQQRVSARLRPLEERLAIADWLDGEFSAGDLMMASVLRRLTGTGLLEPHPKLIAYIARAEARPAYLRAFAAQLAVFKGSN